MAISLLDFNAWFEKVLATYVRAASVRDYCDLDSPKIPVYRCRSFLVGSVILAVASLAFLLFTLNLNALNLERRPHRSDPVPETAVNFLQNLATAFRFPSLHSLNVSRQFEVFAVSISGSIVAACFLLILANIKIVPRIGRLRQLAISSLAMSLELVNYSAACLLAGALVLLARFYGYPVPSDWQMTSAVIFVVLGSVPLITRCVRHLYGSTTKSSSHVVCSPAWLSAAVPLLITYILMFNAVWVNDRFKPSLRTMLSESCGAPDKATCVLTFMPRDIDGSVALEGVRVELLLGFLDEVGIVGPRYLIPASGFLRVIQNSDTPLPLQISTDVAVGVIGQMHFDCPLKLSDSSRKLVVASYRAFADTRILDGPDFGGVEGVPVKFAYNGEVSRLFRNFANGCKFFP